MIQEPQLQEHHSSTAQMTETASPQAAGLHPRATELVATSSTVGVGGDIPVTGTISPVAVPAGTELQGQVSSEQQRPALPPMSEEDTKKLYTGENREYRDTEPQYEQERRESIERAAQISAGKTQFNDHWQVLSDAEADELDTDIEDVPYDDHYVLARDGRVMHRIQLQYSVEKDIRDKLGVPEPWRADEEKIAWYRRQIALLEKADEAPRCGHIYADGTGCRAPKLKKGKWCYAHTRMKEVRPKKLRMGPMEDANAVMLNLMEIGRALCDDEISEKRAGLLLYQQQLGLIAMKGLTFKETDPDLMTVQAPEERAADASRETQRKQKRVSRELTRKNTNRKKSGRESTRKNMNQKKVSGESRRQDAKLLPKGPRPSPHRAKTVRVGDPGPPSVTLDADTRDRPVLRTGATPGLDAVSPMNSGLNGGGGGRASRPIARDRRDRNVIARDRKTSRRTEL